ncbi:reverse transcriptase domain-containing protein [Tanacetum coccineum]
MALIPICNTPILTNIAAEANLGGYVVTHSGGSTIGSDYRAIGSGSQETSSNYRDAGGRPQETEADEVTSNSDDRPALGVTADLAARDADRNTNGDDSHISRAGTKGVAGLSQWFERMESVFHIVGHDAAYGMPWKTLMKMMTNKYCPRNEIKKLEMEIWDLKVKGSNLTSYIERFQELALLCRRMFPEESDKIEKYVCGLPDMIHGSVVASIPKTMQDAVEIATELMDKKICSFTEPQTESIRNFEDTSRNTQNQQQQQQQQQQ